MPLLLSDRRLGFGEIYFINLYQFTTIFLLNQADFAHHANYLISLFKTIKNQKMLINALIYFCYSAHEINDT